MADENELLKLREELKQIQEATRRSRRRGAFGFGILVLALVVCILYSFAQQVAATKYAEEALRQRVMVAEIRKEAATIAEEARRQEAIAKEQQAAARAAALAAREEALAAIQRCKGKK